LSPLSPPDYALCTPFSLPVLAIQSSPLPPPVSSCILSPPPDPVYLPMYFFPSYPPIYSCMHSALFPSYLLMHSVLSFPCLFTLYVVASPSFLLMHSVLSFSSCLPVHSFPSPLLFTRAFLSPPPPPVNSWCTPFPLPLLSNHASCPFFTPLSHPCILSPQSIDLVNFRHSRLSLHTVFSLFPAYHVSCAPSPVLPCMFHTALAHSCPTNASCYLSLSPVHSWSLHPDPFPSPSFPVRPSSFPNYFFSPVIVHAFILFHLPSPTCPLSFLSLYLFIILVCLTTMHPRFPLLSIHAPPH